MSSKKSKWLRVCILSMLTCTVVGGANAATYPLSENTLGGTYENLTQQHFLRVDGDRVIKATEDINFLSSTKLDNTGENDTSIGIIEGYSTSTEGTLELDMQGHNLKTGPYGSLVQIYNNRNNKHLAITNADNVDVTIGRGNLIFIDKGATNSSVAIDANNIIFNKSDSNSTYPILTVNGNNNIDLQARDSVVMSTEGKYFSNLINVKSMGAVNITAGNDISLNEQNINAGPLFILDSNSKVALQAGRDIDYNNMGSNHILLSGGSQITSQAGRNLTFTNLDKNESINMIIARDASKGYFIADKEIRFNELSLGPYPLIVSRDNSSLSFDSEDFFSNSHQVLSSRTNSNILVHTTHNIELHTEGFDVASMYPNANRSMIIANTNGTIILSADNEINFSIDRGDTAVSSKNSGTSTLEAAHGINLVTGGTTDNPREATIYTDNGFINLTSGDKPTTLTNQGSIGAYATNEGLINFYSPTIAQTGEGVVAINKGTVNFQEDVDFTTTRTGATAGDEGVVNFNKQANIYTTGTGAVANTKGVVNFNDHVLIDGAATGATASDEGVVNFNKQAIINASDEGLVAINLGRVNVKDALYLPNSETVMRAESNGVIDASSKQKVKQLSGNILAHGGTVLLNLDTADSYLTGYTRASDIGATETTEGSLAQLDVSLSNGAIWNVTDHSSLTKLTNHSLVNLVDANHNGKSITTKELSGTGTMSMNLDWHTNQGAKAVSAHSDYITATEKASGTQAIVTDKALMHLEDMAVTDRLYFATLKNSEATFTSPITQRNVDKGHLYDYIIGINSETIGDTTDWYFGSVASVESPLVGATAKAHDGLYDLALDIDTLNKRFGEARYVRYEEEPRKDPHGIWARATHMNLGHDTYNGHANRYEIGRDYLMEREDGAFVHRGGSFNYLRATTSYDGGSTKFKRYTGTLYHTWLGNKEHYLDLVGRVGKIHAKTKAYLVDGEQSKASFGTWYQQLSAEWGRRKALNEDWYFEPQVQLQYTHINSKTYTTNDGITNHLDHTNSLIGRLGFRLGHHIDEDTSWYFKADILHEFAGNRSFYLTSINGLERIHYDVTNHDTWYDIGLGINSEMSHNRSIWLEVERKFGGSYSKAWEINGGMTWRFE